MFATSVSSTSQGHIVEFKAGRCKLEPGSGSTKRKVVPEKEKGLVFIKQSEDQLMHFCWKSRETGAVVDDLIIFPGDIEFKEVTGCSDGKVYILKFNSSDDRRLFWIQDNKFDEKMAKKVNDTLNMPPPMRPTPARERNTTGGGLSSISASDTGLQELGALGTLNQGQLMQLLQFMSPGNGEEALASLLPSREQNSSGQGTDDDNTEEPSNGSPSDNNEDKSDSEKNSSKGSGKRGKPDDEMELD